MNRIYVLLLVFVGCVSIGKAQEHKWAFGFYGDVQLEESTHVGSFGVQGKYDLASRSALQAQVHGRSGYVAAGADYLFSILDKRKSNFNVFLGGGISQDFYRNNEISSDGSAVVAERKENFTLLNAQAGLSYYFPAVHLSLYSGYKLKYHFEWEEVDLNYLMLGVRYHLW